MNCEVCGTHVEGGMSKIMIEESVMSVCNSCSNLGKPIVEPRTIFRKPETQTSIQWRAPNQILNITESDDYLTHDYGYVIRNAREALKITQDELGKMLNEKPSVIRLLESKKLRPNDELVKKLERRLKINIVIKNGENE